MNLTEVRELSRKMGLGEAKRLRKGDAIRAIQRAEGNR